MVTLEAVQAGVHSLGISMMKTKTMALAACAGVCVLGAEAVFVPMAMNASYEQYQSFQAAPMVPVGEAVKTDANSGRYIPLTPVKQLHTNPKRNGDAKASVS